MSRRKTVIFLGDGMADEAIPELDGLTPLQHASTPAMDHIARIGRSGTLFTLPSEFPTSSDVANMSVLGCHLPTEYCGRGPVEAAGRGIELGPEDKAFRVNLIYQEEGRLIDYSAGQLDQAIADAAIDRLNDHFGSDTVRFYKGVSYRHIMVLSGPEWTHEIHTEKPDDHQGDMMKDNLPSGEHEGTVTLLHRIIDESPALFADIPGNVALAAEGRRHGNAAWPWNGGILRPVRSLQERHGISSAVISAVDVVVGLGRILGMDVIPVEGATGYIDTNWEGKADACIEALKTHDFVYLHVEGIDEVSHEQSLEKKLFGIEAFDARCMSRVIDAVGDDLNMAVLPDHPVPISIGKHTRTPVPVSVSMAGMTPDEIQTYSEVDAPNGTLGALEGDGLMKLLFD